MPVDTPSDPMPVPPPHGAAAPPRLCALWWVTGPVLLALVLTFTYYASTAIPYYGLSPGSARSVEPLVTVVGDGSEQLDVDDPEDNLLFLTVSVSRRSMSGFETLYGLLVPSIEVVPRDQITGGQSSERNAEVNLQLMADSQDVARKVALERLGYEVEDEVLGIVAVGVSPDYPAAAVLGSGDTILEADGKVLGSTQELVDVIAAGAPGDDLDLRIVPLGEAAAKDVTVELGANPEVPGRALLGASLQARIRYRFPIDVRIEPGEVGGPSAGLAFTLAILDRLSPGRLTGREVVALTGTIEPDGTVGPVGGVKHKAAAAISEGATLMMVPDAEYEDAVRAAGDDLEVRSVSSLDEALAVLVENGGDPLPPVTVDPDGGG